jgi:O-antigen/teichoic acid export membrane protein
MDKALNMGKSSATGSFYLLIGVVGSTVIMALGTFVLGWLLSRDELGLYGVALIPSSMINFFRDWGVNSAMIKQIAGLRAANKEAEIHDVIVSGVIFEIVSGAALSALCFAVADVLASFLQMPASSTLISIMSLSIFAGAILAAANAVFVGFERMKLSSFTSIFSAVTKTALGPLLVILNFGVLGAVIGSAVSVVAGAAAGIIIVYFVMFKPIQKSKVSMGEISRNLRSMLRYGIPLTISNTVVGVLPLIFAFVMAPIAKESLMGDYYAASYFTVLLTFFTIPISTALFPAFAKVNPKDEPELLKRVFSSSVKYTSVLVVPATMVIMALANPIVNTLWPQKFPYAPLFLALSVIINLYVVVGYISLGTFLTGVGETGFLMKQGGLSLLVSLPFVFFLIPFFGATNPSLAVVVAILGILLSALPSMVWGLYWVWKRFGVKADFLGSAKIFAASSIAAIATFLFLYIFPAAAWITLVSGFAVFMLIYLAGAPLIGAVSQTDVDNLRAMFSNLGLVSKLLEIPLKFVEIPLQLRRRQGLNKKKQIL